MWGWVSLADAVFALKSPIQIFTWDFSFYCIVLLRASLKLSLGAGFFSLRCRVGHSNLWTRISCFCGGFPELWPCRSQFSGYLHASIESPFLALMLVFQCCRIPFSEEFSGKCLSDGFLGFPWCPVYRFGIFLRASIFIELETLCTLKVATRNSAGFWFDWISLLPFWSDACGDIIRFSENANSSGLHLSEKWGNQEYLPWTPFWESGEGQCNDLTECYEIFLEIVHKETTEVLTKVPQGYKFIHSSEVQQMSEKQKKMRIDIQNESDA